MKVTVVGDVHLSDTPPSSRTETYTQDILDKLEWIVAYANDHSDHLLLLGDVFHIKTASRNSHRLVQLTASVLSGFKGTVLIVPGNHDMANDRIESLPSQPLGSLGMHPKIRLLQGYDEVSGIVGIPYLDDFEVFHAQLEGLEAEPINPTPVLIATHASIFPPDMHPPYPHMNMDQIDTQGIPLAFGHIHDSMGFIEVDGVWFCNNGAISRGSLHEETIKRQPKITLFDSEAKGCPFVSVDVPHKPAAEVFRLVEHQEAKVAEQKLDEFLSGVGEVSVTSLSLEKVVADAAKTDLSPEAKAELADIIESLTR